jgi:tetratricopeptide (TPR) repeat protein
LRYYQQALLIYREDKDRREEAKRLHAIGKSYYYLNRYEEALRNYQQALPIHREAKDRQGEAVTLSDIAGSTTT